MITFLADRPILLVFVILAVGAAVGAVRVRGVSLGPAGALFAGLALSAIDDRLSIPEELGTLGLALFTYTIGLSSGPAFFSSLRTQWRVLLAVAGSLVLASVVAVGAGEVFGLSHGLTAGLFAGSLTNTPALAAAREALDGSTEPVVGYSVAYAIGVVGMIVAAALAMRTARKAPNDDDRDVPAALVASTIRVRPHVQVSLADLSVQFQGSAVFARVERDGEQMVAHTNLMLQGGDLVSFTSPRGVVRDIEEVLGDRVAVQLSDDRSRLDMRRIVVSNRQLAGQRLAALELYDRFGAVATRLRRGDVDLLAHDDLVLMPGDRLRVVAPRAKVHEITRFLGDSERRLAEVDAVGFMAGIAIGLALGAIEIHLGNSTFALGNAAGPLLIGLVLGRLERTGPVVWQPPYSANLAIRQLGTILFLGTVGSRSGGALVDALSSPAGLKLAVSSVAVVALTATAMLLLGRRVLKMSGSRLAGSIAGLETQPAVLAFANEQMADRGGDDRVGTAYALVFPLAMLLKIIVAQIIALL